jgi:hypothetical protein
MRFHDCNSWAEAGSYVFGFLEQRAPKIFLSCDAFSLVWVRFHFQSYRMKTGKTSHALGMQTPSEKVESQRRNETRRRLLPPATDPKYLGISMIDQF